MFLEICIQIHSVVFALSRQINKQKYAKTINLLCAGNKFFVKYQPQGFFNPKPQPPWVCPCFDILFVSIIFLLKMQCRQIIVVFKLIIRTFLRTAENMCELMK